MTQAPFQPPFSEELLSRIALSLVPGIGDMAIKRLVERFGSATEVWGRGELEYTMIARMRKGAARCLAKGPDLDAASRIAERTMALGGWIVYPGHPSYPELLGAISDPPALLYGRGSIEAANGLCVAMVGARRASSYGRAAAEKIAGGLSRAGVVVVSGLAMGIDSSCHKAAVEAGGLTVAVKGCGLDVAYPRGSKGLEERIVESGAVVTQYPPGTAPEARHFPARNRIISGLSRAVVVVEAEMKSGSLITARLALEQGRDVLAVPGGIFSWGSKGCHWLLKQGAGLVESARDVLEELGVEPPCAPGRNASCDEADLSPEERVVVDKLLEEPQHMDSICAACQLPPGEVGRILLQLELKGFVSSFAGNRYGLKTGGR